MSKPITPASLETARKSKFTERMRGAEVAMDQIRKEFGKGAIMRLEGDNEATLTGVIGTGSVGLDCALGIGGYPRGRVVEIFGPESSGKTTLVLHAIAQVQAQGGVAAYIDADHSLDVAYSRKLGVRVEELLISQPDTAEQALEIAETLIRSNCVDLVVVDSAQALVPRTELEGEVREEVVGLWARMMSQALRKLTACAAKTNACVVFVSSLTLRVNNGGMFASSTTTTGGNALKFYSSVRLDVRRIGPVKDGETVTGTRIRAKVVKNKMAPPFRETEFDILYGTGIQHAKELVELAVAKGLIERAGAWFSWNGERIGQGVERAAEYLKSNPVAAASIEKQLVALS